MMSLEYLPGDRKVGKYISPQVDKQLLENQEKILFIFREKTS
tara:strand:+ start:263 stop:388 length:126 start_codon:yes stop_codon:yes gene_type:complete